METKRHPTSIEQWYEHATNLDKHWRENRRKKKRSRKRKRVEIRGRDREE